MCATYSHNPKQTFQDLPQHPANTIVAANYSFGKICHHSDRTHNHIGTLPQAMRHRRHNRKVNSRKCSAVHAFSFPAEAKHSAVSRCERAPAFRTAGALRPRCPRETHGSQQVLRAPEPTGPGSSRACLSALTARADWTFSYGWNIHKDAFWWTSFHFPG